MKNVKVLALSAAVAAACVSTSAMAEFTGNVGVTSNYVWRGTTQTNNVSAISGGLDFSADGGLYAGTWVSDTSFGSQEQDLYVGFSKEFGGVEMDFGVIQYAYPQLDDADWTEIYVGASYGAFSLQVNNTTDVFATDTDALYIEAAYEHEIKKDVTLTFHVGSYDFDDEAAAGYDSYTDYSISLSKGDFTFAISDTDLDETGFPADDDIKYTVSWGKEFSL